MSVTDCECPQAGWCERHHCHKPPWAWRLCQTDPVAFQVWETGLPPNRLPVDSHALPAGPGLLQRATNLGTAVVRHVVGGLQEVDTAIYEARLVVCQACSSYDQVAQICREPNCGCYVRTKARWATEACPRGKWPTDQT